MEQTINQRQLIRIHLLSGASITALEALREYGCYRLGARISELRSERMAISKTTETTISRITGKPVRFARYFLSKTANAMSEAVRGQQK